MILQTIDLYPDFLRPKPVIFPIKMAIVSTALLSGLLFLALTGLLIQEYYLKATAANLAQELKTMQHEMDVFKSENQKKELDVLLQAKEEAYQDILTKRERLLAHLEGGNFGYSGGFSSYFIALGKQHVQGLWLKDIFFRENSREATIHGLTLSSGFIPNYLTKLKEEDVFSGVSFTNFTLDQSEEADNVFEFSLKVTEKGLENTKQAVNQKRNVQSAWVSRAP